MKISSPVRGVLGCLAAAAVYLLSDEEKSCDVAGGEHRCMYITGENAELLETGRWVVIMDITRAPVYSWIGSELSRFANVGILCVDSVKNAEIAVKLGFSSRGQVVCLRDDGVVGRQASLGEVLDVYVLSKLLLMRSHVHRGLLSSAYVHLNLVHVLSFVIGKAVALRLRLR